MGVRKRPHNLTRRMSQDMHNQEVKVKTEIQSAAVPAPAQNSKSRFNDAEYERWNEKLKSRNSSKSK